MTEYFVQAVFDNPKKTFRDSEFFMSYEKKDAHSEKGLVIVLIHIALPPADLSMLATH